MMLNEGSKSTFLWNLEAQVWLFLGFDSMNKQYITYGTLIIFDDIVYGGMLTALDFNCNLQAPCCKGWMWNFIFKCPFGIRN